jgi:hypothetical protein
METLQPYLSYLGIGAAIVGAIDCTTSVDWLCYHVICRD